MSSYVPFPPALDINGKRPIAPPMEVYTGVGEFKFFFALALFFLSIGALVTLIIIYSPWIGYATTYNKFRAQEYFGIQDARCSR